MEYRLTERQRCTIQNCLIVAAERFERDAIAVAEMAQGSPMSRMLVTQFENQASDARALAGEIEDAEYIEVRV